MKLAPFITFKNGEDLLICQTKYPHYLGLISSKPCSEIHHVQIAGYELYISFKGTLEGNYVMMKNDAIVEIEEVFYNMAMFYLANRIIIFSDRFKKHKI